MAEHSLMYSICSLGGSPALLGGACKTMRPARSSVCGASNWPKLPGSACRAWSYLQRLQLRDLARAFGHRLEGVVVSENQRLRRGMLAQALQQRLQGGALADIQRLRSESSQRLQLESWRALTCSACKP